MPGAAPAVADAAADEEDPMNDIAGGDDEGQPERKQRRGVLTARRSRGNPCKGKIFKFAFPPPLPRNLPE